ncbi:MAG: 23S rRNA (pseudouridine(1915)-N(3))-methyltransferase RlmH [Alphaproteobacteria bacterium]|nr:MAG: 23S rRNA (pseudouridine(1915)-N(3))-methyltransferase RlmH [Alphaproteobacteria bacterium]TAF16072.1 MAG: 23S rRNA (pseudouridine(1915)-N(3))-methyltransferase RlmH [Alphaproteobacteria bacterium]TAF40171.1 MAG: 23S rRNA (pseudouridine(1915)-N(3))-methyltransferase RlmH [Alphaproteobacteria bacterium]TAF75920.1 MAG: 23S rRNA (pseudouridine(1915)-N(3))-methyltransferase RlmH [Alphaproteobacteria bacterium]
MHCTILTLGKWKKQARERELFEHYVARSQWKIMLKEYESTHYPTRAQQQTHDTQLLLDAAKTLRAEQIIVLDETGRTMTSSHFAQMLGGWRDTGTRNTAFLIGGDVGLDKTMLPSSTVMLSFGAMTWPHLLVRGLLAEQLYRAQCILSGHPYHREA